MTAEELQSVKARFGIIGADAKLNRAIEVAVKVAPTDLSVLITGESGVGKEFFPQIIHQYSARKHGQYIPVNCGAIPEGTVDSELFGHEKGAFTSAYSERKGFFEVADGGTIFLDEVGELPLSTQVRLLRVLETGEFNRVGSSKPQKTNVRVVAATNLDMQKAVREGKFREDLYYRLNTIHISVPSLRERGTDPILLFRRFASVFAEKYNTTPVRLNEDAQNMLLRYDWPGNVRQIRNIVDQISILEKDDKNITPEVLAQYVRIDMGQGSEHLPTLVKQEEDAKSFANEREILYSVLFDLKKDVQDLKTLVNEIITKEHIDISELKSIKHRDGFHNIVHSDTQHAIVRHIEHKDTTEEMPMNKSEENMQDAETIESPVSLEEIEKDAIRRALEKHGNVKRKAAKELNISERTLYRKIIEYGLR